MLLKAKEKTKWVPKKMYVEDLRNYWNLEPEEATIDNY